MARDRSEVSMRMRSSRQNAKTVIILMKNGKWIVMDCWKKGIEKIKESDKGGQEDDM